MRPARARKRLAVERLEDRTLPAAHPVAVVGAASYRGNDQLITLDTRADEFVVGLPGGAAALAGLTADGGPLAGLSAARWITTELVIVAGPADRVTAAAAAPGVTFAAPVYQHPDTGGWLVATNEVIVALAPGITSAALTDPRIGSWEPLSGTPDQFVVTAAAGYGPAAFALADALASDPRFAWTAPNFYQDFRKHFTPNDSLYANQWHLNNTAQQSGSQVVGTDVDAPLAWDVTQGSQSVIVSVVDDGMEMIHPDLAPNIAINQGEIPAAVLAAVTDIDGDGVISFLDLNNAVNIGAVGSNKAVDVNANGRIDPDDILAAAGSGGWINSVDGDGNGYIDDLCGWDFTTNGTTGDLNPGADGVNDAHSTSVAGVAVGVGNNGLGTTGLAFRSRMLPVRVFGTTGAGTSDANFASAIYYAAGRTRSGTATFRAGDVMNNSWGGGGVSTAITAAFTWATANGRGGRGTPSFISSGNDYSGAVSFPANLAGTNPGVIAVGASTDQANRSGYSNYGTVLDFTAPSNGGVAGVRTTDRTGTLGYNGAAGTAGDYTTSFGGTSSASPLAAGVGALILAVDSTLTAAQVRALMRNTTDYVGATRPGYDPATGFNPELGYGQVNANRAVRGVGVTEVQVLDARTNVADGSGSVSLGSEPVGGAGQPRVIRVRNQGTVNLTLAALSVTGPFELVSGFGSTTLAVGQSTSFSVLFRPAVAGAAAGGVTFTTNDADEATFDFALTGNGVAPSLAGRAYEDWDGDGTADANDPAVAGRVAFLDVNANGTYDAVGAATAYATGTLNTAIPDATAGGTVSQVTNTHAVSGTVGVVAKVTVTVTITHTYVGDLELELLGPTGVLVPLVLNRGGSGDNFTATVFDDAAATAIGAGGAPFTGSFRPERPLSALNGTSANGSWTLRVRDMFNGDAGTLVNWTLSLSLAEPTMTTAAAGTYAFAGLAAGTHVVRTVVPGGWTATGPAGNSYSQTLAAGGSATGLDFGSVRQNAVYGQMVNDLNGNGVRDGGEPVMAGWRVFDDRDNDGVRDAGEVNALTDALGNYVLPGLAAGATTFRVERQAGFRTTLGVGGLGLTVVANATYHARDFGAVADTTAPTADVTDVSPDPRTSAVPSMTVVFSEAVTGFDLSDLTLRRDGGANLLTGSQTLTTSDNITWTLGNLSSLTAAAGSYLLTLTAAGSGVQDAAQNTIAANAADSWLTTAFPALSVSDTTAGEAGGAAVFTVSLSASSSDTITVTYATADGTATTADGDYTAASGSLTFAPGETSKTVSVTVLNDPRDEADEGFVLNLSSPANAVIGDGQGLATITDDDPQPSLSVNTQSLAENGGALVFTVTLSAVSGRAVTVNYATAAGTAGAADFTAASGTLTFAPGETTKTVAVSVTNDALDEDDETFTVGLSGATNATISTATGTGTITDDDAQPSLSVNTLSLAEAGGAFAFTVTLSAASGRAVTVNYATAAGTAGAADFTAASGTLTFAAGETTKTVGVTVTNDALDEDDETFTVNLSAPTNATLGTATGTGTITDDDAPPALSINSLPVAEGAGALAFTVSLGAASGKTVTVNYATANGTAGAADFTAASGSLTFAPGETTKTVNVTVANDALDEDDETFTVGLSGATNATISTATGTGTITDDDAQPSLSVNTLSLAEAGGAFAFTVTLSTASGRAVTVNYATAAGTAGAADFTAGSGTLTFAPGETTKTVGVTVTNDALDEDDETFAVNLSAPTNATLGTATGTGTITDDDAMPSLSISPVTLTEGNGGSSPFVFAVSLSAPSGRAVSVNYATVPGTATAADFTAASGTLTFAAGETTKTVTVNVAGDVLDEDDETFAVDLSGATNATIATATGTGTITDDDAPPSLSVNTLSLAEGGGAFAFTVTLSAVSGRAVTVGYATAAGSAGAADFTAASGSLTFAPGETSKTVTLAVTDDALDEDDETFTVSLSGATNATIGTATGTGTIIDDDATPSLSISPVTQAENGGAFAFTVTLSAVSGRGVGVNYATAPGTATAADFSATSGTLAFAPGETTKTVTVTVTNDALDEDDETFAVNLSTATNATISAATGAGTITDDDPLPVLSVNSPSRAEGTGSGSPLVFTVSLGAVSGRAVTVGYATAVGSAGAADFTAVSGSLTFAPGETTKTVIVTVAGDALDEDDETFTLGLSALTNATLGTATGTATITDDDAPPVLSVNSASFLEGTGGGTPFVFTVTLNAASGKTVTVNYATADGTAKTLDGDYTAAAGTLTFAPGETTKAVTVTVAGDARNEINETFTVSLSGAANATLGTATGTGTVANDDPLPSVSVNAVSLAEGTGGSTPFAFTVSLSAVSGRTVSVNYATAAGTATTLDGDFTAASGSLTFAPGETTKTVTVNVAGDARNEDDETFALNLSSPTNATLGTATGTATVVNDDPLPALSIAAVSRAEGTGGTTTYTFTATLSAVSGRTVSVSYATADGTATVADGDYTAAAGTLTFAPGVTSRTFTVAVAADARSEFDEAFGVSLAAPVNATLDAAAATGTLVDDDPLPTLSVNTLSLAEGSGGSTLVAFTVTLSAVSGRPVTVNFATADGSATTLDGDYTAAAGALTFAPGETSKTVAVLAAGDVRSEFDETFTLRLSAAANATLAAAFGTATLRDDDPLPSLSVDAVTAAEGDAGSTTFTFTATLSAVSGRPVGVGFATADGTAAVADGDYTAAAGTLAFAPGVTTQTFTVAVTGDVRNEIDETFGVALSAATNATLGAAAATGTIDDEDPEPTLSVNAVSLPEGGALAVTVALSAVSGRTVTVNFATADGTAAGDDYTPTSGVLTFVPGETTKTVTVNTTADDTFEPDETFALTLNGAAAAGVAGGGTGTILNDDAEPTATLSGDATVGEAGGSAAVVVSLSNPSYLPVTVSVVLGGTAAGTDFVAPPASVTIPAGQLSATLVLTSSDDGDDEPNETVTLTIDSVVNGSAGGVPVAVTIADDDVPVAAAADFDLTEDVPFTTPTSLLAAANAQPGSVAELVGAAPGGGTLTLNPNGTFSFTPTANAHGTVGFTYRVRNPAGEVSAPAAVSLRVAAVNDTPTFTPGADQADPRRSGPQVVPAWATGISAGPPDEAGQRLAFDVTTDNPALFAVPPSIDPATGTLRYTPGSGFGTAVVTVRLRDDAGGADTSAARTFRVRVFKFRDDDLPTNQDEVGLLGVGSGDAGDVATFRGDGAAAGTATPFAGASARVVTADVTGDGVADVIAATGPGLRSRVVVTDGATGAVTFTLLPFEDSFTGGLFVAAADVDGDGKAEIAVSPDTGGGGRVTVFGAAGVVADFFGIDDPNFRGGARVTFGDVSGDGVPELVVVAGFGGGPRTAIYDGVTLRGGPARLVGDFFAFPGTDAVNLRNGVFVAAGDVDGDGFADLAFGGGPGGAPRVFVLSGKLVSAGRVDESQAAPVGNYFVAGNVSDRGGVRVAVKDADGDDRADVVAGSGEGSAAKVRVYAGKAFGGGGGEPGGFFDLEPFGGAVLVGGVYVG